MIVGRFTFVNLKDISPAYIPSRYFVWIKFPNIKTEGISFDFLSQHINTGIGTVDKELT